jgi:two-component system, OmpR family, KDP operon response regulator KdpE
VTTGARVLVVDDEPQFLRALATNLRGAGYDVEAVASAGEAITAAGLNSPDAVILDLVLPDGRGTDLCRELRQWSEVPIIVISAVGDEDEKIAALDAGADDYVTKPFAIGELLARLRAALRRSSAGGEPVIEFGNTRLDLEKQSVEVSGRHVHLTPHEFAILRLLASNPGKLLTHRTILREVWGPAYGDESNYLHVYVSQLRRKIEPDPASPRHLLTEPGAGYRLVVGP